MTKRPADGGKGLDGVVRRPAGDYNPARSSCWRSGTSR